MKKIEVYIRSKRGVFAETYRERGCEHTATGQVDLFRPQSRLQFKRHKRLSEEEREALRIVNETAREKGWKVKVYDLSTFIGKIKARIKGVNKTPTVFIENYKMEGMPSREQLVSAKS